MAVMAATAMISAGAVSAGVAATTIMVVGAVATVVGAVTKSKLLMKIGAGASLGAGLAGAAGLAPQAAVAAGAPPPPLGAASAAPGAQTTSQGLLDAATQTGGAGTLQAQASAVPVAATPAASSAVLESAGMAARQAAPITAGAPASMSGSNWLTSLYGKMDAGDKAILGRTIQGAATGAAQYMGVADAEQAKRDAVQADIDQRGARPSLVSRYRARPVVGD